MLTTKITDIANAIRNKTGESGSMKLADMPDKITNIQTGEDVEDEVNVQTPLITEITESLVGKATGANATADKILKGYSAYVGQKLVEGNYLPHGLYVWKKSTIFTGLLNEEQTNVSLGTVSEATRYMYTGDSYSYNSSDKTFKITNPKYVSHGSRDEVSWQADLRNKYIIQTNDGYGVQSGLVMLKIESDTILSQKYESNKYSLYADKAIVNKYVENYKKFIEFVMSDNPNEYPADGEKDGFYYEQIGDIFKITNGTVTPGSTNTTYIPHGLNDTPLYFGVNFEGVRTSTYALSVTADNNNIVFTHGGYASGKTVNWVAVR